MSPVEIFAIVLFLTRTLDDAESALLLPSKIRTLRNRTGESCWARADDGLPSTIPTAASNAAALIGILKPNMSGLRRGAGLGGRWQAHYSEQIEIRSAPF